MNFSSKRLLFRRLQESDREGYFEMMNNPKVMDPIPRPIMLRKESDANFMKHMKSDFTAEDAKVLALVRKDSNEFIGIAAYLVNDEGDQEIGYRLCEKHWRMGFGSETCETLIDYGFSNLGYDKITADVNTENLISVKILDKFFNRVREFHNAKDDCLDRRYEILRFDIKTEL